MGEGLLLQEFGVTVWRSKSGLLVSENQSEGRGSAAQLSPGPAGVNRWHKELTALVTPGCTGIPAFPESGRDHPQGHAPVSGCQPTHPARPAGGQATQALPVLHPEPTLGTPTLLSSATARLHVPGWSVAEQACPRLHSFPWVFTRFFLGHPFFTSCISPPCFKDLLT